MAPSFLRPLAAGIVAFALTTGAGAQTPTGGDDPSLSLSLSALTPRDQGCRLAFVIRNQMHQEIDDLAVEIAIFRDGGALDRLMRLGFGVLLEGKTRVVQFDLDETPCEAIDHVLINDVARCDGGALEPIACLRAIDAKSSADNVEFTL